ncbi:MAG TPA: N-acetylmuramoyl-L-alanine amidase [Thermoanaerobaculia bacterium]|nr:N-acetylmuramoyl-L-alanine amidase [Thermoanaerobaculia bacterium]
MIERLLDRPVRTSYVHGELYLQRDLTDYLDATLGPENAVRPYFMRPHPSVETLRKYFARAAEEFDVPAELLMAVGQVESNWAQIGPTVDQGWGIMHLVQNGYCDTLAEASAELGVSEQELKDDAFENIRGAAALIARYAGEERHGFRESAQWLPALAQFSGLASAQLREMQARNYLSTVTSGIVSRTVWGEVIDIRPAKRRSIDMHADDSVLPLSTDYAPALTNWAPSCNYGSGRNHSIDTWVNHWIGTGTYAGTISWFQTCPGSGPGQRGYIQGTNTLYGASSAHFVIKNSNGEITQMVAVANTSYHAGASGFPYNNGRSIGVEHEATSANPAMWKSAAMLNASATMARYFKDQYGFPTTQNASPGIAGHNDMPGTSTACPGPLPWSAWMAYFNGSGGGTAPGNDNCSGATTLSSSTSCNYTAGTVLNATASGVAKPTCDGFSNPTMKDVWYKFTAVATSQSIAVDPDTSVGDPVVTAYSSCGGSQLACQDGAGEGGTETLSLSGLTVGNTYYVRVYDYGSLEPSGADANFRICLTGTPVTNYTLSVSGAGNGSGTVTGNGINCSINSGSTSGTCSASFSSGTNVPLTATPNGGSTFTTWGGACSGAGGCTVTMSSNKSVSASFAMSSVSPSVLTDNATSVTETTATINGRVNPNNASTSAWFEWGPTNSLGNFTSSQGLGSGNALVPYSANLSGLTCGTTYYYRASANNSGGTASGSILTFSTSACPPPSNGQSYYTVTPCRIIDTRDFFALQSGTQYGVQVASYCNIPMSAVAVAANIAVTQPTDRGNLTVWPWNEPKPLASSINFSSGLTISNNAVVMLATDGYGDIRIEPAVLGDGTVHVIIDVVGYFQ